MPKGETTRKLDARLGAHPDLRLGSLLYDAINAINALKTVVDEIKTDLGTHDHGAAYTAATIRTAVTTQVIAASTDPQLSLWE